MLIDVDEFTSREGYVVNLTCTLVKLFTVSIPVVTISLGMRLEEVK